MGESRNYNLRRDASLPVNSEGRPDDINPFTDSAQHIHGLAWATAAQLLVNGDTTLHPTEDGTRVKLTPYGAEVTYIAGSGTETRTVRFYVADGGIYEPIERGDDVGSDYIGRSSVDLLYDSEGGEPIGVRPEPSSISNARLSDYVTVLTQAQNPGSDWA